MAENSQLHITEKWADFFRSSPTPEKVKPAEVPRSCGSCSLCCIIFNIDELEKPKNVTCPHCSLGRVGSCNIYDDRPKACIDFRCIWLQSGDYEATNWIKYYRETFRPDKIGALMDVNPTGEILLVRVKKYREFAGLKKAFRLFVGGLADFVPLLIVDGDGTYRATGKAIFDWFEKGGYDVKTLIDGKIGRDTFEDTLEGRKGLYEHLANSKINKVKVIKQSKGR